MRFLVLFSLSLLTGCQDPALYVGASIDSGGVSVSPAVSGRVGGVGVAVSP